eukprot:scaffold7602_cov19-Tisochrysis_lutea.AAC.3
MPGMREYDGHAEHAASPCAPCLRTPACVHLQSPGHNVGNASSSKGARLASECPSENDGASLDGHTPSHTPGPSSRQARQAGHASRAATSQDVGSQGRAGGAQEGAVREPDGAVQATPGQQPAAVSSAEWRQPQGQCPHHSPKPVPHPQVQAQEQQPQPHAQCNPQQLQQQHLQLLQLLQRLPLPEQAQALASLTAAGGPPAAFQPSQGNTGLHSSGSSTRDHEGVQEGLSPGILADRVAGSSISLLNLHPEPLHAEPGSKVAACPGSDMLPAASGDVAAAAAPVASSNTPAALPVAGAGAAVTACAQPPATQEHREEKTPTEQQQQQRQNMASVFSPASGMLQSLPAAAGLDKACSAQGQGPSQAGVTGHPQSSMPGPRE